MMFDADIVRIVSVAKVLPSRAIGRLIEDLIEVLDQRGGDPDLEEGEDIEDDRPF